MAITVTQAMLIFAVLFTIMAFLNGVRAERTLIRNNYQPLQSFRFQIACIAWMFLAMAAASLGIILSPAA